MSREPVAWAVIADGFVMAANRNTALLEDARRRLVAAFPGKVFESGLVPLYREPPELGELARALVEKLDVVHEDPAYKGVWGLHYVHGGHYTGPTYTDELGALRSALAQYEDKGGTG